jgi:hypothetical protein
VYHVPSVRANSSLLSYITLLTGSNMHRQLELSLVERDSASDALPMSIDCTSSLPQPGIVQLRQIILSLFLADRNPRRL